MTEGIPSIKILFSDEFKDRLRILAKRYRSIRTDIQPLIDDLQIGKFIGDKIPGIGYTVFKVRLKNSDIQKGKSSGYRVKYLGKINYILASKIVQHFFNVSEEALSVFIGAKFNPFIF